MRDPNLDMENRASGLPSSYGGDVLDGKGSRGGRHKVSFESTTNGQPTALNGQPAETSHEGPSAPAERQVVAIRPKSSVSLHNTYDELYRSQVANGNVPDASTSAGEASALHTGGPPPLTRARSDYGPRRAAERGPKNGDDESWKMRHGWEDEYSSTEYLSLLNSAFFMYYTDKRHETGGIPREIENQWASQDWRMKDRLKTVSAALAICLNIGVDPPDVVKTNPCAKLEAWQDPTDYTAGGQTKIMEQIGKKLQEQYETLSLRTRYKQYLDPSIDEAKKFCVSLRRNAKDERVLFHYNGHGVPLPTASGELWVFNKNYTQYIPVPLYDLQAWLAGPSLFVYDVSHAGNIIHNFQTFIEKHEKENEEARRKDPNALVQSYGDCIQLAACGRAETLPTNPDLPADLFTCCLTTPIEIALRFFILQNPLATNVPLNTTVPGRLQDRRSPLGELNWIFTAITDTIAWNILPRALFKKLFRQDLTVAALFRNFLLSERIMRANHCHPMSSPELPEMHQHPLWQSWDLAIEMVLAQLPALRDQELGLRSYEYQHSSFFAEQLTAFEVYLSQGPTENTAPDQLPIVLQVLLSQAHRLRALILLSKFLDLGPWAVHLALSIGIFPYVVKLLQSAAVELKPVMVFIWARIMAVDRTVQTDLLKDNGIHYFITIFHPASGIPVGNASEHRAMCAFIIAIFCREYTQGQTVCMSKDLFEGCLKHLAESDNPLLRQWSSLCLSMLWLNFPEAKWMGIRTSAHTRLCDLSLDPVPEVRASMLHALTNFLGIPDLTDQVARIEESIASSIMFMTADGSKLVRMELLVFYSTFVKRYENKFMVSAYEQMLEEKDLLVYPPYDVTPTKRNGVEAKSDAASSSRASKPQSVSKNTIYSSIWRQVLILSVDPDVDISQNAGTIVDYIHEALLQSPMGSLARSVIDNITRLSRRAATSNSTESKAVPPKPVHTPPTRGGPKPEGYLSLSMRRTASVAASLKNLAFGGSSSQEASSTPSNAPSLSKNHNAQVNAHPAPLNTPRGRMPAEWTRPPEVNDPLTLTGGYQQAKIPNSRGFKSRDLTDTPVLPLKSRFLDWSTEVFLTFRISISEAYCLTNDKFLMLRQYFREPQMKPNEPDEPGSADYNQRLWRRSRNERIIADNQPLKEKAGSSRWEVATHLLNNTSQPMKMVFHQFEDHLAVADDRDTVCIWDFQQSRRLNRFSNGNPLGSKINEARFINEDDQALLMVGSSDGVLKVFRDYESSKNVEVVTTFRALTDLIPSNKNAGLVFDWQQGQGKALVAGDVKVIKVWNAATETCTNDIPARSGSCITSLTSDQVAGQIFIAGFGDGCIRVFDQRLKPTMAMVKLWREHKQWITNVHMQRGGVRELVSGSRNGEIRLWDLRVDRPVGEIKATSNTMRTLSVHEHAPVFAVGSDRHDVKTFNMNGAFLSSFEPHTSWALNQPRLTPVAATAYHPHRMLLACAALNDSHVNLLTC